MIGPGMRVGLACIGLTWAAQICICNIPGKNQSIPIGLADMLHGVMELKYPCSMLCPSLLLNSTGYSAGLLTCQFQHRLGLYSWSVAANSHLQNFTVAKTWDPTVDKINSIKINGSRGVTLSNTASHQ